MIHAEAQFGKFSDPQRDGMKTRFVMVALAGALLLSPLASMAQTAEDSDKWSFSALPYFWLPDINGKLSFGPTGGGNATLTVNPDSYLGALDFAAMLSGAARKGRWVIGSDLMYLHFSDSESKVQNTGLVSGAGVFSAGASVDIKGVVWTTVGGYAVVQEPKANLDVLAGFRYLGLDVNSNLQLTAAVPGSGVLAPSVDLSKKENIWAGIVGARGRFNFGESDWFANGYVDVGGGSSTFTWQGVAGVGYAFKWGDVILDYRYLYYSQDDGKLIDSLSFGGLALGANFRF